MSDQPAHPPAAPNEDKAAPPSTPAGKIALPKTQVHTVSQHIFIWTMVVVVGVLFGMGGTMSALKSPGRVYGKIEESEILLRMGTAKKLQDMINPGRRPRLADGADMFEKHDGQLSAYEQWARDIQEARIAESQGLLPGGAALEAIKADFLNHPLEEGSSRRFADAMREHSGGEKELTSEELARFLAERTAVALLIARNVVAPALPPAMADLVASYIGDKVEVDELVLDAKHLLAKVADDDADIQSTYDQLRSSRFGRPRAAIVSIAYADTKALAEKTAVGAGEVEKYYNAHKEQYKLPPKPPAAPTPTPADAAKPADPAKPAAPPAPPAPSAPEYRPLAEVSAEITATLKKQQAEEKAHQLVQAFNDAATDLENQKDNAGFKAAAAKGGLLVKENVLIEDPGSGGTLKVGEFGELNESQLRLFGQEVNYLFSAIQSTGPAPSWVLLRLDDKRDAGFRELKDPGVRAEVMAALAGKRAYKDLLKEAEAARAAAEKLGPGGLKKYASSEAAKPWAAVITAHPQPATTELRSPPAEVGGVATGDPRLIASLALLTAPVMLASAPSEGAAVSEDVPRVRLVQATGYTPAPALGGDERVRDLGMLHSVIEGYRRNLYYNSELRAQLGK